MSFSTRISHFLNSWLRVFLAGFIFVFFVFTLIFYLELNAVKSQFVNEFYHSSQKLKERTEFISGYLGQRLFLLENSSAMQRVVNDPSELATVGLLSEWSKFSRGFNFKNRIYYIDMSGQVILKLNHENEQPVVSWGGNRTTALTQYFKSIKWAAPGQVYMHKLGEGEYAKYILYLAVFDKWASLNGFIVQEVNQNELNSLVQDLSSAVHGQFLTVFQSGDWNAYNKKSDETVNYLSQAIFKTGSQKQLNYNSLSDWEYQQLKTGPVIKDSGWGLLLIGNMPGFLNSKPIFLVEFISLNTILIEMYDWLVFWGGFQLFLYLSLAWLVTLLCNRRESMKKILQEQALRHAAFEGGFSQLVADQHGKTVAVNAFHCRLVGMRKSDLIGLNADAFMLNMSPSFSEIIKLVQEYSGWHGEVQWINSKGKAQYTLANVSVIFDPDGSLERYIFSGVDLSAQKSLERQLQALADTDPLTGSFNRRAFETGLAREFSRSLRSKNKFSILMIDIDYFKVINDNYGHDVGDRVLVDLVREINVHIRTSDLLSRWGGEEFVLLLPDTNGQQAMILAERLRQAFVDSEVHPSYTASIGVCEGGANSKLSSEALFKAVDKALYKAKSLGRNRVVMAVPEQEEREEGT